MKCAMLLMLMLAACTSPAESVVEHGGPGPVDCYRDNEMLACRDHALQFWVCHTNGMASACMRADEPARVFNARNALPEASK